MVAHKPQNTSVVRELIPASIFVTMACPVPGGVLDRYGDIWGGYFLLALMQNTNYHAAFGRPSFIIAVFATITSTISDSSIGA